MKKYTQYSWAMDSKTFGMVVKQMRDEAGLSQNDVASVLGVSGSYIGYIEKNNERMITLRIDHVIGLCNLFDLDPRDYYYIKPSGKGFGRD